MRLADKVEDTVPRRVLCQDELARHAHVRRSRLLSPGRGERSSTRPERLGWPCSSSPRSHTGSSWCSSRCGTGSATAK